MRKYVRPALFLPLRAAVAAHFGCEQQAVDSTDVRDFVELVKGNRPRTNKQLARNIIREVRNRRAK